MTDNDTGPILPQTQPIPGGSYAGETYEHVISDLNLTVAELSAAIPSAEPERAADLRQRRNDLIRLRTAVMPTDPAALAEARKACAEARDVIALGSRP
ncbi:hypothetical protein [Streptomyces griseocarneus]|uniref:hypothetical protein n=1 Tax=Streptomyces griseocarneus TaxID=51201 RepID=UPI00167F0687|nr:hypothetical protein [Streptomyces griseocarneus]MBZ6475864.1 hypothetical protein [Streptomyces griseocarneus]GHG50329.1 hypothetical protein GCM10018779_10350 [Streptomyces griseocarneus]